MKYVVTGISLLTGERTVISSPKDKEVASRMVERQNRRNKGRGKSLYRKLRIEPADSDCMLQFVQE